MRTREGEGEEYFDVFFKINIKEYTRKHPKLRVIRISLRWDKKTLWKDNMNSMNEV